MFYTRHFADESEAEEEEFDRMKNDLSEILETIASEENLDQAVENKIAGEIELFVEKYP